jgi:hypothetical protein
MADALRALLTLRLRQIVRAGLTGGPPRLTVRRQGRSLLLLLVLVYFGWRLYSLGAFWVATQSALPRPAVFTLIEPALTALASAATTMMLFYAFSALLGRFLEERDLQLLLVAPVPAELIFGERILITSLGFSGVLLIAVPALFAIGTGVGVTSWFYVAVLIGILVLPLAPSSMAALVLLALLGRLPPARARTISLAGSLASVLLLIVVTRGAVRTAGTVPSLPTWLPTTWPARAISATGAGDGASVLGYGLLSVGLAAALFVGATILSARVLGSGMIAYREVRRRPARHARVKASAPKVPRSTRHLRPVWWPIFTKDWLTLRRDPQRQILFLYPLALVAFNAYQILSHPRSTGREFAVATTLALLILACLLLVNTTAPGIVNWEGRSLILLALAPIPASGVILSKWMTALIPPLVLVEAALTGLSIYLRLPTGEFALLALSLALLTGALAGTTLTVNISWPRLDATNPRRPSSATAGIIGLAFDGLVSAGTGVGLFLGLFVWHGIWANTTIVVVLAALAGIIFGNLRLAPVLLRRLMHNGDLMHGTP